MELTLDPLPEPGLCPEPSIASNAAHCVVSRLREFMCSYNLKLKHPSTSTVIEITEEEYLKLQQAELQLGSSAQIEEKIDLLLENYLDYENELLKLSLNSLIRSPTDNDLEAGRPNLNRKLTNILTAAKLYVDQTKRELSNCYGKKSDIYREWNLYRNNIL